jgi:predicted nucleic-acid-binding Zn-ribbon protein
MFSFASSKCPHCKNGNFELAQVEPSGSRVKMNFIQCMSCKAPLGVAEYYDAGSLLKQQGAQIAELNRKIDQIDYNVQSIMSALNHLRRAA